MSSKFKFMEMHSGDVAKAKSFYTELFGWNAEEFPMPTGGSYTFLKSGGEGIGGIQKGEGPSHWLAYVGVDDAAASTKRARSLGAKVEVDCQEIPGMGTMSVFVDPNGARFALWQEAKKG
jgi:predicted enzyme related to lactoylglutathione lyase